MTRVVYMIFGAHLYGTATDGSDTDYAGVFVPELRDLLLCCAPKSQRITTGDDATKNTVEDTDTEFYSLQRFVGLALAGETVALDMLHAPESAWLTSSPCWEELACNRHRFYSKNLRALVGYARKQAAKYGVKGSRLADASKVLEVLSSFDDADRTETIWGQLPELEHAHFPTTTDEGAVPVYEVCGRKLQATAKISYNREIVARFVESYGARARAAERNEGIDWKAVSHAFRAGYQVRSILRDGDFTYPLLESDHIREIKSGSLHYRDVGPELDELLDELEALNQQSDLPEKPDRRWAEDWLIKWLGSYYTIVLPEAIA